MHYGVRGIYYIYSIQKLCFNQKSAVSAVCCPTSSQTIGSLHRITSQIQAMFVGRRVSGINKIFVIELVGLILFLLYTNPTRVELDSKLLKSLNTNFVKGAAKYLRASFNGVFANCLLYSHLYIGTKGHYFGIGGLWIDPHYWSSVSG